jgi:hypothetical protein
MERGTAGQFMPFNDDDVLPTHLGQVIGNACSADSSSDDYGLCMSGEFHVFISLCG